MNEIIWQRTSSHNRAKRWGPVHDSIFYYGKSEDVIWNRVVQDYDESYIEDFYRFEDDKGRYRVSDLTGPGVRTGDSGQPWRSVNPTDRQRHWEPPPDRALPEWFVFPEGYAELSVRQRLDILNEQGLIHLPAKHDGIPGFKRYLISGTGAPIQDVITDIPPIQSQAAERLGYPTQKPLVLLERIIAASSNEGDVVLDPFCGCGTAVHAAEKLKRQWVGIDITHLAISLIEKRLKDAFPKIEFEVVGTPKDFDGARRLAEIDKYQFQWWACSLVGAQPYQGKKKGADGGIDGLIFFQDEKGVAKKIVVSVKGGDNVSVAMIRDLAHVVEREKAQIGFFVTLAEPTGPMATEAVKEGFYESPFFGKFRKLQILTISDLLSGKAHPEYPVKSYDLTFKKAKVEDRVKEQSELF